jgi:hypothetical protein
MPPKEVSDDRDKRSVGKSSSKTSSSADTLDTSRDAFSGASDAANPGIVSESSTDSETPSKRPRGRPRKDGSGTQTKSIGNSENVASNDAGEEKGASLKKKEGADAQTEGDDAPKKRRGRPPKAQSE